MTGVNAPSLKALTVKVSITFWNSTRRVSGWLYRNTDKHNLHAFVTVEFSGWLEFAAAGRTVTGVVLNCSSLGLMRVWIDTILPLCFRRKSVTCCRVRSSGTQKKHVDCMDFHTTNDNIMFRKNVRCIYEANCLGVGHSWHVSIIVKLQRRPVLPINMICHRNFPVYKCK